MVMEVEQTDMQAGFLIAPTVVTAILEECGAITDYRTLRDTLPRRLANVLRCRSVLLYQRVGDTLQFASGSFDDKPGWSASLLAVAHINPVELNSNLPEAAAWRSRHAVTAPASNPHPMLVAVPLIYRQKEVGVLVALRTKERDSDELEALQRNGKHAPSQPRLPVHQQPALPHYWTAEEVQVLEAVAAIVALLLENTRLLERDRERIHELALLNSISSQMSGALYEWERMQSIIIQRTREIAASDLCAVLRPSSSPREAFSWLSPGLREKLFRYFNSNTAPLVIERPGDEGTQAFLEDVPPTIKTFFAFPLLSSRAESGDAAFSSRAEGFRGRAVRQNGSGDKVPGIVVGAYHRPWKLRREELVMLQVLASQASAALENTQLMAEVMEARNEARKLLRQVLGDQRLKELILQSIPSGLITVNLDGQITTFNQAAQTILSYPASEALGLPLQSLFTLDAGKMLASGQEQHRAVEVTGRNGQELMLDMYIMPLHDDRNIQIGALLTFTDVTVMHRLEEEKRRLDRLASLGEMSASVAHEVRNPLASIKTSMQMLMDDLISETTGEQKVFSLAMNLEAQESIAVVLKEVERLDSIVRDLLLFARPRQLHLVLCNLAALSDHVLAIMQGQCADAGVEVQRHYSDIPPLRADIAQMEQVLFNLFTNAIQAMPDGGILTVACRAMSKTSGAASSGQWLEFSVSDTGSGVAPDQRERIFQPFFTTRAHGIGLGLSITRRLIEDHRGSIRVESQPGRGATFTLLLPVESREEDEHGIS